MAKILAIKHQVAKKSGKPYIIVNATDREQPHWLPYGMWTNKELSDALNAYVGGEIDTDYFQEGEELNDGSLATSSDAIVRDFAVQMRPAVLGAIIAAENAARASQFSDLSAMFRNKRNAALAEKARLAAEEAAKQKTPAAPTEA